MHIPLVDNRLLSSNPHKINSLESFNEVEKLSDKLDHSSTTNISIFFFSLKVGDQTKERSCQRPFCRLAIGSSPPTGTISDNAGWWRRWVVEAKPCVLLF